MLEHMRRRDYAYCVPATPAPGIERRPLLDFSSGYVERAAGHLPGQGSRRPWRLRQNYFLDYAAFRFGRLDDGVLQFGR